MLYYIILYYIYVSYYMLYKFIFSDAYSSSAKPIQSSNSSHFKSKILKITRNDLNPSENLLKFQESFKICKILTNQPFQS